MFRKEYRFISNEDLAFRSEHYVHSDPDFIDLYLDPALRNLMRRFGKMVKAPSTKDFREEQIELFKMRVELETMQRMQ